MNGRVLPSRNEIARILPRGCSSHPTVPYGGRSMKEGIVTGTLFGLGTCARRQAQWNGVACPIGL